VQKALLAWYARRKRPLPWRKLVTPYRTWISEIMLQQTTVQVATPYFERFLCCFPDIQSLSRASEEEVLKAWAGLGYYSRARNIHAAAKKIVSKGGNFPDTYEEIISLPGIGPYTAGAILSIAFQKPYPVVDGNVTRVLARLYGIRANSKEASTTKRLWGQAKILRPQKRPGDWNQALMELGSTVCIPDNPDCRRCPISGQCWAFKRGIQDRIPLNGKRPKPIGLRWTCLWIEKNGKVLLWKRSPAEKFLRDHWGLPEGRHLGAKGGDLLKEIPHTITHHRITLKLRKASPPTILPPAASWVPLKNLKDFLISSLWLKCLPN
jgi:A/G-specific adenine glycosylase